MEGVGKPLNCNGLAGIIGNGFAAIILFISIVTRCTFHEESSSTIHFIFVTEVLIVRSGFLSCPTLNKAAISDYGVHGLLVPLQRGR